MRPPFLFAPHKHHLGAMVDRIRAIAAAAEADRPALRAPFESIGAGVCDVYDGALSPAEIAAELAAAVGPGPLADAAAFARHLEAVGQLQRLGHYLERSLSDGARFVLRVGDVAREGADPERYVHVHPGRHAPRTFRAKTNVLKTALLAHAEAASTGEPAGELALINRVRARVELSPLGDVGAAVADLIERIGRRLDVA